jgi:hypothetical protein
MYTYYNGLAIRVFTSQWRSFEIESDFGQHKEHFTPLGD